MDEIIKSIASIIGLISGLIALGKGAFDLIKEYQANKDTLRSLMARRSFRIAAAIALAGILVLIGVAWWATQSLSTQPLVTVQVWDVQLDQKNSIVASTQFPIAPGGNVSDDTMRQIGKWVSDQISKKYTLDAGNIQARVRVPADLNKENIDIQFTPPPASPALNYIWVVETGKSRVPLDSSTLKQLGKDFSIELNVPGYSVQTINVKSRQEIDQTLILTPTRVGIGVEEFGGTKNSVAIGLTNYLSQNPRLAIKDPNTLDTLRKKIENEKNIPANPILQVSIRTTLGVDLIIGGAVK